MNKEQQIEEMTNKMEQNYEKNGLLNCKWFAEALYNAGYREVLLDIKDGKMVDCAQYAPWELVERNIQQAKIEVAERQKRLLQPYCWQQNIPEVMFNQITDKLIEEIKKENDMRITYNYVGKDRISWQSTYRQKHLRWHWLFQEIETKAHIRDLHLDYKNGEGTIYDGRNAVGTFVVED